MIELASMFVVKRWCGSKYEYLETRYVSDLIAKE